MTLLLYAIGESAEPEPGAGGPALQTIRERSLVAYVSEPDQLLPPSAEQSLWEYERVVESLMDRCTILPARFGSRFEDEPQLRAMVRDRHDQLAAAVDLVRGAVELSLSATWPEDGGPASTEAHPVNGTAYMLDRVARHRAAMALAAGLEPLASLARASSHRLLVKPTLPFVGAYLVDRAAIEPFSALVRDLDRRLEDVGLVCTGPWPPYSFTENVDGGGAS